MWIKSIQLRSFGKLSGRCEFAPGKTNVICQENEFGKSTLADAILYALYGFPPSGGRRGQLKAKDKYKPWHPTGRDQFQAELEICDVDGRSYRVNCNFARQQPFEVIDLDTKRPVPLEGMSFGQRFFRMPAHTFADCFFLRQEDRDVNRDDLVQIIEEAAASNRKGQDSPIRGSLNQLAECKLQLDEFSPRPLTLDSLLQRIESSTNATRAKLGDLVAECQRRKHEIAAADEMDAEIARLQAKQLGLEHDRDLAEMAEAEELLKRLAEQEEAQRQRRERVESLSAFARFDPAQLQPVQELWAILNALRAEEAQKSACAQAEVTSSLQDVEVEMQRSNPGFSQIGAETLDRLKILRSSFCEAKEDIAARTVECDRLRNELADQGVPIEDADQLGAMGALSPADRKLLLDHDQEKALLESGIGAAAERSANATILVAQARERRERLRTTAAIYYTATLCVALLSLASFTAVMVWKPGTILGIFGTIAAAVCAGLGFRHSSIAQKSSRDELEPALASDVSATGDLKRLREQLETLDLAFADTMRRRNITEDNLQRLKQTATWAQMLGPYVAVRDGLSNAQDRLARIVEETCLLLKPVVADVTPATLDQLLIDNCIREASRCLELGSKGESLRADSRRREDELTTVRERIASTEEDLEQILGEATDGSLTMEQRVAAFIEGCTLAIHLKAMESGMESPAAIVSADQARDLRSRVDVLKQRVQERCAANPELSATPAGNSSRVSFDEELERIKTQREELRVRRANAFSDCDRAIEAWRREGPALEAELDRIEAIRARVTRFRDAIAIAHTELSTISEVVFAQWAAAINQRVSSTFTSINPSYRDVELSENLEPAVYSEDLGRRLSERELMYLSRGVRDQLTMSIRIAISEYLSAHVGDLPLLFDEAFAHWDDDRFVAALRTLKTIASKHQVILLTCHRWRFEELRRRLPDLANELEFCTFEPAEATSLI